MSNSSSVVCYASDDNYAMLVGISMLSLFEKNKHLNISVYFLVSEISEENEKFLRNIAKSYNRDFIIINVNEVLERCIREKGYRLQKNGKPDSYSRIFITEFLPKNINRCLYLDCDTLITDALDELIFTDISDFACAAVLERVSPRYKKWIGLKKEDPYFNSGVLLINLDYWRKNNVRDTLLTKPVKNGWFTDQDMINYFLQGKIKTLKLRYNATAHIEILSYSALKFLTAGYFYKKEEINEALNNPAIIHYCANLFGRPWHSNCELKSASKWEYYFQKTEWNSLYEKKEYKLAKQWMLEKLLYKIPFIGETLAVAYGFILEKFKIFLFKHKGIKK